MTATSTTTTETPSASTARAEYVAGLRKLADVLEAHEEVPLPFDGTTVPVTINKFSFADDPRPSLAAAIRAFPCNWDKSVINDEDDPHHSLLTLNGSLRGLRLQLTAYRDAVCERVVTGTEDREVEEVVTPAVTRKVIRQVETVEWVCSPVLAPAVTEAEAAA